MVKPDHQDRQERLAEQLRANLKKRKAQERARDGRGSSAIDEKTDESGGGEQRSEAVLPDHPKPMDD